MHLPDLIANLDRLQCNRLLLTHAGPQILSRRAKVEIQLAADGAVVQV